MKHTITRSLTILIAAGLFAYVGWLFLQGYHVTAAEGEMINTLALALCAGLALFMLSVVFMPSLMPTNRWTLLVLGILVIMASELYLEDVASRMIYLKDIMKLIGVFLVIIGPMKLLVSPQIQEKIEEQNVEIIEV